MCCACLTNEIKFYLEIHYISMPLLQVIAHVEAGSPAVLRGFIMIDRTSR